MFENEFSNSGLCFGKINAQILSIEWLKDTNSRKERS